MKQKIILLILALTLAILFCSAASAATPTDPKPVTTDKSTTNPAIDDKMMVYEYHYSATDTDIYMKNLETGTTSTVCSSNANETNPDVSKNYVVYQRKAGTSKSEIYWRDMNNPTSSVQRVYSQTRDQINPRISGTKVVWQYDFGGGDWDIYGADLLVPNSGHRIASTDYPEINPDIAGDTVVYQKYVPEGTIWRVYKQNFNPTGDPHNGGTPIVNRAFRSQMNPAIGENRGGSGNKVAWEEYTQYNGIDIFWVNNVWTDTTEHQISHPGGDYNPQISGNYIIYSLGNADVFMKDLRSDSNPNIYVANTPAAEGYPTMSVYYHEIYAAYVKNDLTMRTVYWRNMADDVAPTIQTPTLGTVTKITTSQSINIIFNEAVTWATRWIDIQANGVALTAFTKSLSSDGRTLTIMPVSLWATNTYYNVILHTGYIKDYMGNSLAVATRIFTTDVTAPTIKTPLSGTTTSITRSSAMTITFSEPVKWASKWIEIQVNGVKIPTSAYTVSKSSDGKTLTIKPVTGTLWKANTTYNVIFHTGCLTDRAGNKLAVTTRKFKTGST